MINSITEEILKTRLKKVITKKEVNMMKIIFNILALLRLTKINVINFW